MNNFLDYRIKSVYVNTIRGIGNKLSKKGILNYSLTVKILSYLRKNNVEIKEETGIFKEDYYFLNAWNADIEEIPEYELKKQRD